MRIKVRTFAMLREIIGAKFYTMEISNFELTYLLDILFEEFPRLKSHILDNGIINPNYVIAINGEYIDHDRIKDVILHEEDTVAILPPAGGG